MQRQIKLATPCSAASRAIGQHEVRSAHLVWAFLISCLLGGQLLFALSASGQEAASSDAAKTVFATKATPLLKKYCVTCHAGEERAAGLDLAAYEMDDQVRKDRPVWEHVVDMVVSRQMPPQEEEQPTDEERAALAEALQQALAFVDCGGPPNPGKVTIRRLNRNEYNNTIRDLTGVDLRPADDFPSDDVGYGFDHIGDVLSLPPLLMEKYIDAAEKIADAAIRTPESTTLPMRRYAGEAFTDFQGGARGHEGQVAFISDGTATVALEAPSPGIYHLAIFACGDRAGDEPPRMRIELDGQEPRTHDVTATPDDTRPCEFEWELGAGSHELRISFVNDFWNPDHPNPAERDRNLYVGAVELEGPRGLPAELPASHAQIIFVSAEEEPDPNKRMNKIIRRFASRAFRRPATKQEMARLKSLADQEMKAGASFEYAVQSVVAATLVSPHFLFRVELDRPETKGGIAPITDYELATRLSYLLWSSMPDSELFELARKGILKEPGILEFQARRMIRDPKAEAFTQNFAGQWLQLRTLDRVEPDRERYPDFDDELRRSMRRETELFFQAIINEDLPLRTFLDADFTYLNARLARHYGLSGVDGDHFRRVSLAGTDRGGLVSQASILTVTSNPTRTSPVKRGKWVLEQLWGTPPPAPPPGAGELPDEKEGAMLAGTLRQRMEQHRANPNCAICHQKLDPMGFGLENYDAIGAWRTQDGGIEIDASGVLPDGKSFSGPIELRRVLIEKEDLFRKALAEKLLTYALGRGLESYDACAIRDVVKSTKEQGDTFSALLNAIIRSDPFLKRMHAGD